MAKLLCPTCNTSYEGRLKVHKKNKIHIIAITVKWAERNGYNIEDINFDFLSNKTVKK